MNTYTGSMSRLTTIKPLLTRLGLVVLVFLALLVGLRILDAGSTTVQLDPAIAPVAVQQVFVDVDGDGDLDLLLRGEVVLNSPPLAQPLP